MKKPVVVVIFLIVAGVVFGQENDIRKGIIVDIKEYMSDQFLFSIIYIDSDNDKIVDALIILKGDYYKGEIIGFILAEYIKIGDEIEYIFDRSKIKTGIFYDPNGYAIRSINKIPVQRFFPLK
jgi:hypothetical protein